MLMNMQICVKQEAPCLDLEDGHTVSCWLLVKAEMNHEG